MRISSQVVQKETWEEVTGGKDYHESFKEKDQEKQKEKEVKSPNFWNWKLDFKALKPILYGLIILVLAYVIFRLLKNSLMIQNKKVDNKLKINIDNIEDHLEEADIPEMLQTAVQQGHYRQAVRLHFLLIMRHLVALKKIVWQKNKTNGDYLYELNQEEFYDDFRDITLNYERVWYGDYTVNKAYFEQLKQKFDHLNNMIVR